MSQSGDASDILDATTRHHMSGFTQLARRFRFPVPAHLRARQVGIDPNTMRVLADSIATHYHKGRRARERFSDAGYQIDLHDHLTGRLELDRSLVVPWLNAARPLQGLRILEVGCGTGSSTVALAEQGAVVTGIDVDTDALVVARTRCELYRQQADLRETNAVEAARMFQGGHFDLVILFACLEHMTIPERLESLPALWGLLEDGGMLAIVDTPNRLWFFDEHTSWLPFFNWLPDQLAFVCSRFSRREQFRDDFRELTPDSMQQFLRAGRGASYHEFDATIGAAESLRVVSSLSTFRGWRHAIRRPIRARLFKALLKSMRSDLHDGYFEPSLDLIIAKQSAPSVAR
jgi:2-polyprenyl-3-methyl-5-hydroxy-6-metoxy-1,4-benzoquinol methylase